MLSISIDAKALTKDIKKEHQRHIPFAIAKTLTDLAKTGADAVRDRTKREFKLHGEFIPNGIRTTSASKTELRETGYTQSTVYTAPRISTFMPLHETGGQKVPYRSRKLSVPGRDIKLMDYRTNTGKAKKAFSPSGLLEKKAPVLRRKGRVHKPRAFILRKNGKAFIVRRRGTEKGGLDTLYMFRPEVEIKPLWHMEDTVKKAVDHTTALTFERNWSLWVDGVEL